MKEFYFSTLILSLGLIASCSKSDPVTPKCGENFFLFSAVSAEIQGLSSAAMVYAEDPNESNCEKYRASLHTYINALEKWEDCVRQYGEVEEWRESLQEARHDVDQMDCK